jgi:hypothetical protein
MVLFFACRRQTLKDVEAAKYKLQTSNSYNSPLRILKQQRAGSVHAARTSWYARRLYIRHDIAGLEVSDVSGSRSSAARAVACLTCDATSLGSLNTQIPANTQVDTTLFSHSVSVSSGFQCTELSPRNQLVSINIDLTMDMIDNGPLEDSGRLNPLSHPAPRT